MTKQQYYRMMRKIAKDPFAPIKAILLGLIIGILIIGIIYIKHTYYQ